MSENEDLEATNRSAGKPGESRTARKRKRTRQENQSATGGSHPPPDRAESANWSLLILAAAGTLLTAYLSYTAWSREELMFCTEGSACDLVQSSHWSTLFALPLAAWGFLTYGALALCATLVRKRSSQWKLSWIITLVAVAISTYLTAISIFVIGAMCGYCLASYVLLILIFVLVVRQKPAHLDNFSWDGWLLKTCAAAVLIVTFLQLHYSGVFNPLSGPEDDRLQALAIHLSDTGAKFYGASWCPHCQEQKRVFTASAKRLPYIECSPTGRQGARATECVIEKIVNYPTWIISRRRYERGVIEAEVLARLSKFDWDAAPR